MFVQSEVPRAAKSPTLVEVTPQQRQAIEGGLVGFLRAGFTYATGDQVVSGPALIPLTKQSAFAVFSRLDNQEAVLKRFGDEWQADGFRLPIINHAATVSPAPPRQASGGITAADVAVMVADGIRAALPEIIKAAADAAATTVLAALPGGDDPAATTPAKKAK